MYISHERLAGGKITQVIFCPTPLPACPGCWWQGRQGGSCLQLPGAARRGVAGAGVAPKGGFRDKPQLSQLLDLIPRTA